MPVTHNYMDVGGRVMNGAITKDAVTGIYTFSMSPQTELPHDFFALHRE